MATEILMDEKNPLYPLIASHNAQAEEIRQRLKKRVEEIEQIPLRNDFAFGSLCCPSFLSCVASTLCPWLWCCACSVIDVKQEKVLLNYGKYFATLKEPGCYLVNPCGIEEHKVWTTRRAIDLANVKVADQRGNPCQISGIVTYQVVDALKATLKVSDFDHYIKTQGLSVMKRIAAQYPYETRDGTNSLKGEAEKISSELIDLLQDRVDAAGILVVNFELTDLAYAPEVAARMLLRQSAEALVDARKIIVKGAVEIAHGAIVSVKERGIDMSDPERARLVTNLLVTICSESGVQNTVQLSQ